MGNFTSNRFHFLDNLETFSSEDETSYFPFHFHEYYCVSLITRGTELLENTEQQFYATAGTISVTQANEVHRNKSFTENGYSYKTIYVNPEVLKFNNNNRPVSGLKRVINDTELFRKLTTLFSGGAPDPLCCMASFEKLVRYAETPVEMSRRVRSFSMINEIIEDYPNRPINSHWLARQFCMSEFHFIRTFKNSYGVTPQVYIMLYRLGLAKRMITEKIPLNQIATRLGFTDCSHFTRNFKKYFGVAPSFYLVT